MKSRADARRLACGKWPTITQAVRQSIKGLEGVVDITATMHTFDRLQYEAPVEYTASRIVRLRKQKMRMSQAVFASACNVKLPTLQKWERGCSRPTPPVNRPLQLVERGALSLVSRQVAPWSSAQWFSSLP